MSLLSTILLVICILYTNTLPVKAIDDLWVEVTPRRASSAASYKFHFTLQKKVNPGQWITLQFPKGCSIYPPIPSTEPERSERLAKLFSSISVSLKTGKHTLTTTKEGLIQLKLFVQVAFDPANAGIVIVIPINTGFVNPSLPGTYTFGMMTEPEPILTLSEPFLIVESKLSNITVVVDPPVITKPAGYKIAFSLGTGGALKKNSSFIQISFPSDTKLLKQPSEIEKEWITINNIPLFVKPEGGGRLLKFLCPIDLLDASKVVVKIDPKASIQNPGTEGSYRLMVSTSTDINWEKSEVYEMYTKEPLQPKTLSIKSIVINPNNADTLAIYKIEIQFGENKIPALGDSITIEFSFIDSPITVPVTKALPQDYLLVLTQIKNPNPGSYHFYLSTTPEPQKVLSDKFAILPPLLDTTINLFDGEIGDNMWYTKPPKIKLTSTDHTAQIEYWVDDKPDQIKEYQGIITLKPGEYRTTIHYYSLTDLSREEAKHLTIQVDTIKPTLKIEIDSNPLQSPVIIRGSTDPNCVVTLDQKPLPTDRSCGFSYSLNYREIGFKCNEIESVDLAGNITKKQLCYWFGTRIIFQINSTLVTANDKQESMPIAPYVKNRITLVPFRYMGEKLQAKISFKTDPKTKLVKTIVYTLPDITLVLSIGSDQALVNDKLVKMDLAPEIAQGYTVVPLRFVSETLGYDTSWDAPTKKITLEYPKG